MRTLVTIVLTGAIIAALSSSAEAGRRRRGSQGQPFQGQASAQFQERHPPLDARELYPKYYGGFHARALQNIGIPTGDIGIRGNGITTNPW